MPSEIVVVADGTAATPPVTRPDKRQESHSEVSNAVTENMQCSPNAMNGYGPYSSPEMVSASAELSPDKLPVEELKSLLRNQLEFYFSRLVWLIFILSLHTHWFACCLFCTLFS